ncbi:hypothetical protein QJS04_geneDACA014119 [Acorus gramineus]|uniref:C2 NT-type domain-containing protein n=1 Tax=Acorus gramineus TaxID=55184 RepID=A0AAV9B778_ACOGR|nr:hypothetical protein QJS04_geneDACA014119 [Acorus gramineus]
MVLGLRTKSKKVSPVHAIYFIHVQEIKPWPPSQSLRSLRSVLLEWENGEKNTGSLSPAVPILGLGNGDGKIEFNESFKMKSTLLKEGSTRNGESSMFKKNTLEFNLYELRKDGTVKGHLICTATIDLSEHGIVKEAIDLNVRMDCKRVFSKTNLPVLSVKICPFEKESNGSSSLLKETSLNKDTHESVSALMNEEYAEEAEVSSFTDDDMSSHSSLTTLSSAREANSGSPFQSGLSAQSHQEVNGNTIKPERVSRESLNASLGGKVRQLQHRVKMLEGELRDAAAAEVSLYSIVAEHGSSAQKVHTPARRLSRIYIHAFKQSSPARRASAARSAVSGLVLAAKACGNDVPRYVCMQCRLTFWLSNSVVLRVIITEVKRKSPTLKWNESTVKERVFSSIEDFDDWEDPKTFTAALEKIEDWIFSRILESVWWQVKPCIALAPHMQLAYRGSSSTKSRARKAGLSDHQQANLSIDLWKEAFKDACERLCPVRAGGHECGCLPVLARLVMEQCVARLDVAMFNAILRESDDDVPTDPVSDPITDSKVLPVPSGRLSFGAGAQLKNAIGNWSRWLSDLFGLDDAEDEDFPEDDVKSSLKTFHLLNALSDLLMLPKDLLLDKSIRKEVCPTFGAPVIRRVLSSFVPDEFCPDPVPEAVLKALDSEESLETSEEPIRSFPCSAAPLVYTPPSPASVTGFTGDLHSQHQLRRSRSSILRRCQTSDDELDELGSPLASIVIENGRVSPTVISANENTMNSRNVLRYQLLREVWQDGDF